MEEGKYKTANLQQFSRKDIVRNLLEAFVQDSTLTKGDIYSSIRDFPQEPEVEIETWAQFLYVRAHAFVESLSAFRTCSRIKEQPEKLMKILMSLTPENYPEVINKIPEKVVDEILDLLIELEP